MSRHKGKWSGSRRSVAVYYGPIAVHPRSSRAETHAAVDDVPDEDAATPWYPGSPDSLDDEYYVTGVDGRPLCEKVFVPPVDQLPRDTEGLLGLVGRIQARLLKLGVKLQFTIEFLEKRRGKR